MAMRANPCKFENPLDEAVWDLWEENDAEVGSKGPDGGLSAALFYDGPSIADAIKDQRSAYPNVTDSDIEHLLNERVGGVIVTEDSGGKVTVKYYASRADIDADWNELVDALEEEAAEDGDEVETSTAIVPVGSTALATTTPVLEPGYAYALDATQVGSGTGGESFKSAPNDDWDTVVISDDEIQASEFVGRHKVDDALVCVFWNDEAYCFYAQVPRFAKNARSRLRRNGPLDDGDVLLEVQMYDRGRWVPAHGRGSTGFTSVSEAQGVARNLRERGIKTRVVPISYASNARRKGGHRRNASLESFTVEIPDWGGQWRQIGGDIDPGKYGGVIATADGHAIELIQIQPTREYVGDSEARDVGFPFWSKEGYYTLDDLSPGNPSVKSALKSIWDDPVEILEELTPEQRAVAIAESLLEHGIGSDEGTAGWAKDVLGSREVVWSTGLTQGYEYIADEDDEFRRDVLEQYEVVVDDEHEAWHDDEDAAVDDAKSFEGHVEVKAPDGEVVWDSEESGEHEPNRKKKGRGLQRNASTTVLERSGVLDELLEMQAETLEPSGSGRVPREVKNALSVTPELRRAAEEYEQALRWALSEVVMRHPPNDGATSEELFDDNAPYLVLMTLRGEGVGIWDGDWSAHYDDNQIKAVERTLKNKLSMYADDTGSGKLTNAMDEAVYAAAEEAGYELTDEGYVERDGELEENRRRPKGSSRGRGLVSNHGAHARYDVFLNGEMLEPVYMDAGLTNAEVRDKLIATGYDPRITVDRPPARRTNLPPHYKLTANRKWSRAYMDTLPDSAFLYVAPGGRKDLDGKTIPRRLRHFPYKDQKGQVDLAHLRNALSRIPQSKLPRQVKDAARARAEEILASHGGYR